MLRALIPLCISLCTFAATAAPLTEAQLPTPLQSWVPWVLNGDDPRPCAWRSQDSQRQCAWPTELDVSVTDSGAQFTLNLRLDAPGTVALPGSADAWPLDVTRGATPQPVMDTNGVPTVQLPAGDWRLQGRLLWPRIPDNLRVPTDIGLLRLSVNGQPRPHALRDGDQLRLGSGAANAAAGQQVSLQVYRLLEDAIPPRLTTHLRVQASGELREEVFGPVLPAGWTPLSLSGDLPARIDSDGKLHVQLRPGTFDVSLIARAAAPLKQIARPAAAEGWPEDEVWSFQARSDLRSVDVSGAAPIDPQQTQMPEDWRALPAYHLPAGITLAIAERQRGQAAPPADQIEVQRDLWLDFDGGGYTLRDRISGQLNSASRLEAKAPLKLGQVRDSDEPRLITGTADNAGVEVREHQLNIEADARIEGSSRTLPVNSWNLELQQLHTTLHLPPGWRLFAASGADHAPNTWIAQWTLLDLFLVLVIAVAAYRLFGPITGAVTLIALVLIWHEPYAPHWSWINLIAVLALLKVLPEALRQGSFGIWLVRYRHVSVLALALLVIGFAIPQARALAYPQLEPAPGAYRLLYAKSEAPTASAEYAEELEGIPPPPKAAAAPAAPSPELQELVVSSSRGGAASAPLPRVLRVDPSALIQTGPGLPTWQWSNQATLDWEGPVTGTQTFRLWLLPPWLMRVLRLANILLVAATLWYWLSTNNGSRAGLWRRPRAAAVTTPAAMLLAVLLALPAQRAEAQEPSQPIVAPQPPSADLLQQLHQRLLANPDCADHCVDLQRLRIALDAKGQLSLRLSADATIAAGMPLPVPPLTRGQQGRVWQPASVQLAGRDAVLSRDTQGRLWIALPAGRSDILISGSLESFGGLQLPLPLKPRRVEAEIGSWQLSGVDERGQASDAVELLRPAGAGSETQDGEQALPALWTLTRTLTLDQNWELRSTLTREGSLQNAASLSVPLVAGEQVTDATLRARDGALLVNFAPGESRRTWASRLDIRPQLQWKADARNDVFETWEFIVGPLWRTEFAGLPAVGDEDSELGQHRYQPWPGESLKLSVTRPAGMPGQTLTLDETRLQLTPGQHVSDLTLSLVLRSAQGGVHKLKLPEGWTLQSQTIDGQAQSLRLAQGELSLPLHPGTQTVNLALRSDQGLSTLVRTPAFDVAMPGVNANVGIALPPDRWLLYVHGPAMGPALLFWGVALVLIGLAWLLGHAPGSPLRAWQWALLLLGLSQIPLWCAALVAGWLFALALRGRSLQSLESWRFNLLQVLLALWTLTALLMLFSAVKTGLLGQPDMRVIANAGPFNLEWYQDRHAHTLPQASAVSLPLWVYRVIMLAWALWLATSLVAWLRWGWQQFSAGALWKRQPAKPSVAATTPTNP